MRLGFKSVTTRLIVILTVGVTVFWCAAALISSSIFSGELDEAFDNALRETAQRLLPLAADDLGESEEEDEGYRTLRALREADSEYIAYQIFDRRGRMLIRSHDAPSEPYPVELRTGYSTVDGLRLYVERDHDGRVFVVVAEELERRNEVLQEGSMALFLPLAALLPLSALMIWLAVRAAMRPVSRLGGEIAARGRDNLTPIETSGLPKEITPIAEAVAQLMERLKSALDAERTFAANSAHELRTPIAAALAQTQLLMSELKGADAAVQGRAGEIETALKRLANLSEKLMQLSRADAGITRNAPVTDLKPVLDLVVRECRQRSGDADRITYESPAVLQARMDADAFAMAARNLIDNALLHGAAGAPVEVVVETGTLRVVNDGPVVPRERLEQIIHPFSRGETEAVGSGLGLSIVNTIARQAGGSLELRSPARDRADGFEAVLTLPKA